MVNTRHVAEVNQKSLFETISWCSLCSLQISRVNTFARYSAIFNPTTCGMKCTTLENLSIITHSSLHPQALESGRSVLKSQDSNSHGAHECSSGNSSLYCL